MLLWDTRRQAEAWLAGKADAEAAVLQETFGTIDECVARLDIVDHPFARVCGLTLIKARNLGLACYSLSLDALAQEAGALLRPLLETLELLNYFRQDPSRIEEALDGRLPKAGEVAQRIGGKFKGLRDHLSAHASHFSFGPDAMLHLIHFREGRLRSTQPFSEGVLRRNLQFLFAILAWVGVEAVNCVSAASGCIDDALGDRIEDLKDRGLRLFDAAQASK